MGLVRFGVSLEHDLFERFDKLTAENKYTNRSEAIRDLIRDALVKRDWISAKGEVAGVISIVYDHHKRELADKLIGIQHDYQAIIISTQHAHLSHDNCIEVLVVRGSARAARELALSLRSIKGIKHADFIMTTTGKGLR